MLGFRIPAELWAPSGLNTAISRRIEGAGCAGLYLGRLPDRYSRYSESDVPTLLWPWLKRTYFPDTHDMFGRAALKQSPEHFWDMVCPMVFRMELERLAAYVPYNGNWWNPGWPEEPTAVAARLQGMVTPRTPDSNPMFWDLELAITANWPTADLCGVGEKNPVIIWGAV